MYLWLFFQLPHLAAGSICREAIWQRITLCGVLQWYLSTRSEESWQTAEHFNFQEYNSQKKPELIATSREGKCNYLYLTCPVNLKNKLLDLCVSLVISLSSAGRFLTNGMLGVERFALSFKTDFKGFQHRHVVLGISYRGSYGTIGMSRREDLMYKPVEFKVTIYLAVCLPIFLFIHPYVHSSIYLSVCLSIYTYIHPFIYLFICQYIHLFIHQLMSDCLCVSV